LWDIKPRSEPPTRDFFKLLGVAMLIAVGIGIAAVFSAKYNIDSHRFGKYVVAVVLGVYLLASGTFRTLYRMAVVWFNQGATKDDEPG
jgi:surface polysaccharide O-acyltransferase-like enzyme